MSTILKQTLGVSVGLGAVAAGAWFLSLRTLCTDLASLRAQSSLQRVNLAQDPDLAPNHAALITDLEARIDRAKTILAATPATEKLYDTLQESGKASGVRIDKLEPSSNSRRQIDLTATAGYKADTIAFDIEASGEFDRVVAFIASLERDLGLSKVATVRIQPMPGQPEHGTKVVAQVSTAHFIAIPSVPPATDKDKKNSKDER